MKKMELTKMSSRGQVVIPKKLRKGIDEGTPFLVSRKDDVVMLQKISVEEAWKEFDRMFEENRKIVKRTSLKESDVMKIIHRIRREERESKSTS